MNPVKKPLEAVEYEAGFEALSLIAYQEAGLKLSPNKAAMFQSRLRHRLALHSLHSLEDYCKFAQSEGNRSEIKHLISALTTNVSSFFREMHHFDTLQNDCFPAMKERLNHGEPVRIWSAGCSNGQEPYSIAMQVLEYAPWLLEGDFRILATDIDTKVIRYARDGKFTAEQVSGVSKPLIAKYFIHDSACNDYSASPTLRNMISFRELNLNSDWPMRKKFDVIFCRNVVIYFDGETQSSLWEKIFDVLKLNSTIFVGHSERINNSKFISVGATTYEKQSVNNL